MTASLLEEVEKRRVVHEAANSSSHSRVHNVSVRQPEMLSRSLADTSVVAALRTTTDGATSAEVATVGRRLSSGASLNRECSSGIGPMTMEDLAVALPLASVIPSRATLGEVQSQPRRGGVDDGREGDRSGAVAPAGAKREDIVDAEGTAGLAGFSAAGMPAVSAPVQRNAEFRQIALATIGVQSNRATAERPSAAKTTIVATPSAASTSVGTSRVSPAFSAHSVRQGTTLGYYGRAEVETLAAISKNPSRVAAYNRIVEGKHSTAEDRADVST